MEGRKRMSQTPAYQRGMEKARREIEERFNANASNKTNIGVLVDGEVWKAFKIRCIEEDLGMGETLTGLIDSWVQGGSK
jgi:hypothetical protein